MTNLDTIWSARDPLILASQSTIRAELLNKVGFIFDVQTAKIDERQIEAHLSPADKTPKRIGLALAEAKARAVSKTNSEAWVIGADQILEFEDQILHKVKSSIDAQQQLFSMAGKQHQLHSAAAIVRGGETQCLMIETATLTMRTLSSDNIRDYCQLAGDHIFQCVGSYQYEGLGRHLFERVDGRDDVILGLPLDQIIKFFRSAGCLTF